jgi:hypothetical protein
MDTVTKKVADLVVGDIIMGDYPMRITSITLKGQSRFGDDMYRYTTEGVAHPGVPYIEFNSWGEKLVADVQPASCNLDEALARLTRTISRQIGMEAV